jgi:hypothetical protein
LSRSIKARKACEVLGGRVARADEHGLAAIERAITLNPNSALGLTLAGWARAVFGEAAMAITMFERSMRLSPRDPRVFIA